MTQSDTPASEATTPQPAPSPEQAPETQPTPEAPTVSPATEPAETPEGSSGGVFWGTGRRKSAVARVRIMPGSGRIQINKRPVEGYFTEPQECLAVRESLIATSTEGSFDVFVNVRGGGHSGQAGAIRLGIARALVRADQRHEPTLRDKGYLTRDARVVERKKYGQRKARRRFQFSKR